MNKIVLQLWEESERGWGIRPDGCSIHLDDKERLLFIDNEYSNRSESIPDEYERIVGGPLDAYVTDSIFGILTESKSIRLAQHEMSNLLTLEDLIIKED